MGHHCEAAVVTCEDFRLHERKNGKNVIRDFIKKLGVDCDLITRGGCIQDLVRPKPNFNQSVMRDLAVSVDLHSIQSVHIVAHEDCGAYASFNFKSREEELARHFEDLHRSKQLIFEKWPKLLVKIYFASLVAGTSDLFEIEEVK